MKPADVVLSNLLAKIEELTSDPEKIAVEPGKDFTRNRKLGANNLIRMLLTMEAVCINEELYTYFGYTKEVPTKAAFCKQRCKLNQNALPFLLRQFNKTLSEKFYNEKYRFLACDGSGANIFRNPDDPDTYYPPSGRSKNGVNLIHIDYISQDHPEYDIKLHIIRFELSPGCFENIITNLPDDEFDFEDFKYLYFLRWGEENCFRDLKYPLALNFFHSKKYQCIVQEIWARAILHNFSTAIIAGISIPESDTKHHYQVNFAQAFKICRAFLRNRIPNLLFEVERMIAKHIEAIRPGRTFDRQLRFNLPFSFCYRH